MNLPPYFWTGCERPRFEVLGSTRMLSRIVRSRRPSVRTSVVIAECWGLPFHKSNVTTCNLPARREEDIETEYWRRDGEREDTRLYRTAKELRAAGFRFDRRDANREFVVVCPMCGNHLTTTASLRSEFASELQIVSCTWARDEDERRLAEIAEQLVERLLWRLTHPPGEFDPAKKHPLSG